MRELIDWLVAAGGYVGPCEPRTQAGLRGLFITHDGVRAGEPLVAVPRECTLRGDAGDGRRPIERLLVALLYARSETGGRYSAYLDSLPHEVPLLRDWDRAQLSRLRSPDLSARVTDQRDWLNRLCETHSSACGVARADVRWAERLVRSRGVAYTDEAGRPGLQLVPLLDLANHRRHEPDAEAPIVETADGMTVLCASPAAGHQLRKGDQATFAYTCNEGNSRLLLDYGFAQLGMDVYAGLDELDALLTRAPELTVERLRAF